MNLPQLMSDYSSEKNSTADFQINKGQIGLDNNLKKERNETKQRGVSEIDDSFEIFVPLKVKNNNKKLNYTSPNKLKKKTVSSNRISPYFSARKTNGSSQEDKDIQIALARSLADISPSNSEDSVLKAVLNKKKSKENSDFLKSLTNKTKKSGVKSLLFRRTDEERQSILTKKVAIVLLEKENISDECFRKCEIELISSVLEGFWDKNCTLWEHSKTQFNNIEDFYVTALQKFIEKPLITSDMPEMNASENTSGEAI